MSAVKRLLEANGFDMQRYHEEAFGPTRRKSAPR